MIALTSILALTTILSTYVSVFVALFFRINRIPSLKYIVAGKSESRSIKFMSILCKCEKMLN